MVHIRLWIWLVIIAICLCGVAPAVAQPGNEFCDVDGMVTFDDGTPTGGMVVTVIINNHAYPLRCDKTGAFQGVVPVGSAIISVAFYSTTATLDANKLNNFPIVLKHTGVILAIQGDTANFKVNGGYTAPAKSEYPLSPTWVNGACWFTTVPPNATEFRVTCIAAGAPGMQYTERWPLQPAPRHDLTLKLPRFFAPICTLVDAKGKPLGNAPVNVHVQALRELTPPGQHPAGGESFLNIPLTLQTDANGVLQLPKMIDAPFTIAVRGGDRYGGRMPMRGAADGVTTLPPRYVLGEGLRSVRQTVIGKNGAPAKHATVTATFCWLERLFQRTATTDADGVVVWTDLPPVRAIITGDAVAPGVLPADAVTVTAPLPAPTGQKPLTLQVIPLNAADVPVKLTWTVRAAVPQVVTSPYTPGALTTNRRTFALQPNTPFSVTVTTAGVPPRGATLEIPSLPYPEEGENLVEMPLLLAPAPPPNSPAGK